MFKKFLLLGLSVLSYASPFFSPAVTNENIIYGDNGELVNLYNYNSKKRVNSTESTPETATVYESNVNYDLRYIFGGEDGYNSFNINDLKPKESDPNERYKDFKFLCSKIVDNDLFLYVYHEMPTNYEIVDANVALSLSNELTNGDVTIDHKTTNYMARWISSYGYKEVFSKFVIKDIVDLTRDFSLYVSAFQIDYLRDGYFGVKGNVYTCNHELDYDSSRGDFLLDYFGSDYVRVTEGEVGMLLTRVSNIPAFDIDYNNFYEDFYYFFSTDYDIRKLLSITYDYDLVSYTDKNRTIYRSNLIVTDGSSAINEVLNSSYHDGLIEDSNNVIEEVVQYFPNQVVSYDHTEEVHVKRPYYWFWPWSNNDRVYALQDIQNCLDLSNLYTDEDKSFKEFIEKIQESKEGNKYQWCYRVTSTLRNYYRGEDEYTDWSDYLPWLGPYMVVMTDCHEVSQTMITYLEFQNKWFQKVGMNVLDIPRDTSSVYVESVHYRTFEDDVTDFVKKALDSMSDLFNNLWQALLIILLVVLVILLLVFITPIISFIKGLFKTTTNVIKRKKGKEK